MAAYHQRHSSLQATSHVEVPPQTGTALPQPSDPKQHAIQPDLKAPPFNPFRLLAGGPDDRHAQGLHHSP